MWNVLSHLVAYNLCISLIENISVNNICEDPRLYRESYNV